MLLTKWSSGGVMMAVVWGLLDEHQVVGGGNPDTSPVQPQSAATRGLDSGGVFILGPQVVSCNDTLSPRALSGSGQTGD